MQLAEVVKVMVGDICRLTDYVGNQFSMRPIMGYPPPVGQVSQVEQGVQRQGGGGVADGPRNPPVPHHNHYETSGERVEGYVSKLLFTPRMTIKITPRSLTLFRAGGGS